MKQPCRFCSKRLVKGGQRLACRRIALVMNMVAGWSMCLVLVAGMLWMSLQLCHLLDMLAWALGAVRRIWMVPLPFVEGRLKGSFKPPLKPMKGTLQVPPWSRLKGSAEGFVPTFKGGLKGSTLQEGFKGGLKGGFKGSLKENFKGGLKGSFQRGAWASGEPSRGALRGGLGGLQGDLQEGLERVPSEGSSRIEREKS